jgi:hypothetical protein
MAGHPLKVVLIETAPAALAGANTRRKPAAPLRLTPLSASRAPRSTRYGQAALGSRPLRLVHYCQVQEAFGNRANYSSLSPNTLPVLGFTKWTRWHAMQVRGS